VQTKRDEREREKRERRKDGKANGGWNVMMASKK